MMGTLKWKRGWFRILGTRNRDAVVATPPPRCAGGVPICPSCPASGASAPFSEPLPALMAGTVDMVVSGMTITPQRTLKVAFVGPYFISGKGILAKKEKASSFGDENQLNNPQFTLAALKGSTSQLFVQGRIPKAKLITPGTLDEALRLLFEDKVDALVADIPYCVVTAFRYQDKGLAAGASPFTFEPLGVALPENDPLLTNWVANILGALQASGDLGRLAESWFKDSSWLRQLP